MVIAMYRIRYKRYWKNPRNRKIGCNYSSIFYLVLAYFVLRFVLKYFWLFITLCLCYVAYKVNTIHTRQKTYRDSGIDKIDKMKGIDFEKTLAVLFRDLGYRVIETPASGDFGADLIIEKYKERIVVQ